MGQLTNQPPPPPETCVLGTMKNLSIFYLLSAVQNFHDANTSFFSVLITFIREETQLAYYPGWLLRILSLLDIILSITCSTYLNTSRLIRQHGSTVNLAAEVLTSDFSSLLIKHIICHLYSQLLKL